MTSMLSGPGFGGSQPESSKQRALKTIDSTKQTFANKDFVRNIAWLNESVTYMSQTMVMMQKGIDEANQNFIEQIQGFIADLLILFAGGEPTGIKIGDLKYIFQGIGALLGINPDTPFPLNLVEAAWHIFSNYIIPVPQFTDLLFDTIIAWAEDLGFSDEAIDALQEFDDTVVDFYNDLTDLCDMAFGGISDMLKSMGLGTGALSMNSIFDMFGELGAMIENIISGPREALLSILSMLIVVIFKALTWFLNTINPMHIIQAMGLNYLGPELVPPVSNETTVWTVGSNMSTQWVWDSTVKRNEASSAPGSFKTSGNGTNKRILTQAKIACVPDDSYQMSGWVKWENVPADKNTFGVCVVFYTGANELSQTNVNVSAGHGATGGWQQVTQNIVVPQNADGMKFGARISSEITSGTVWVTDISCLQDLGPGGAFTSILGLISSPLSLITGLLNGLLSLLTGGTISGDTGNDLLDSVLGLLTNIPIIGDLITMFTGGASGDNEGLFSGLLGTLSGAINDILSLLGLGGGGGGDGDGGGGTPGSGGFDLFGSLISFLEGLLPAGLLTSLISIPINLFASLVPGTSNNVLPTGATGGARTTLEGQGLWVWDWPSSTGGTWFTGGCARTVRPGLITIFWVTGVWEQLVGGSSIHLDIPGYGDIGDPRVRLQELMSDIYITEADWDAYRAIGYTTVPKYVGDNLLDWDRFEVIFVPYSGALYPLGYSIDEGVATLIDMVKKIPGKFILMGGSLGATVVSKVFQQIVNEDGSLHHRNDDLLMGWAGSSPMRAEGATWPDNPFTVGPGHGCLYENLATDDPRWWEWSVTQANTDYPAFDQLDGISWPNADPISALGDDTLSQQVRALVQKSYGKKVITANDQTDFMVMLITESIFNAAPANVLLGIGFNETQSPHGLGWWVIQPFLAQDDHRSFWRYTLEYINDTFGPLVSPDVEGVQHQLEGIPQAVKSYQVVTASVPVMWGNVVCTGPAIMLAVNAYDENGNIITGPDGETPSVVATDATISDPVANSEWTTLEASFVMPEGAKTAKAVYSVEPMAMTSGIVWFDISNATFTITDLIDASLLANMENFPGIEAHQVGGVQGEANMLTAIQNLLDGMASAAAQGNLTGVQLAELFGHQGITAISAAEALTLAIQHERALSVVSNEAVYVGLSPTGEATFELQTLPQGTTMPDTTIPAGTTLAGYITCKREVDKGFIEFMAQGGEPCDDIYVNVYELNTTTGDLTLQWASDDISSQIPNGYFGWVMITIPDEEEVHVTSSEIVLLEIVAEGDPIDVVSRTTGIPNKNAIPPNFGATRTTASTGGVSPATLDFADLDYDDTRPFISFGIQNIPPAFHPPLDFGYTDLGLHYWTIPEYARVDGYKFDMIGLGGGGAGNIAWLWVPGLGGLAGQWDAHTFTYGTEIPTGTEELAIVVGSPGYANAGSGSSTIVGYGNEFPLFDAVGPGSTSGSYTNMVWNHTATAGATVFVAFVGGAASSVDYGGTAMTYIGGNTWQLDNASSGEKTITAVGSWGWGAIGNSISYTGVDSVGTVYNSPANWEPGQTVLVIGQGYSGNGELRYHYGITIMTGTIYLTFSDKDAPHTGSGVVVPLNGPNRATLINAPGGAGASSASQLGMGPGTTTYNGRSYFGGSNSWGIGATPGGGGVGAYGWGEWGSQGARGEFWGTMRQT